ncbi:exodeoxyribonuclease VII large subunit [Bacillaceae bacterium SIJ1]|uniref:exodeoxyribonuclease VII large subunit n=1 Tax=Litoribacterium kuwaitense TaxID=1398745 RepID=UPI0013EB424E|nr:exodeoxyribonuclease VII large subunit [Litoribacterium kuwaitense]NGP43609.1 exodeoxyribonuclease VII large subunit [Litoribacterium kuwaitense]
MSQSYVTVSALTKYIKKKFDVDRNLQELYFRAELSNVKKHSRGHIYCTLKDDEARIQGVMFKRDTTGLAFSPEDGQKVLVCGTVSVYVPYGQYQVTIHEMTLDGRGNLYLQFEKLKKKLAAEGLFHEDRKRKLPRFPKRIGVITSPTGAAIRDIWSTIKRRYPAAYIDVYPVLVQGKEAPASIVKAIEAVQARNEVDVLIVGRGGGSIEELWAFNEEIVARAIVQCTIPTISAVGHETDVTIADFVADVRAATPTGAAELAVPEAKEWLERLQMLDARLLKAIQRFARQKRERLEQLQGSYAFRYPRQLIQQKQQDVDRIFDRLLTWKRTTLREKEAYHKTWAERIYLQNPQKSLENANEQLERLTLSLLKAYKTELKRKRSAVHEKSLQLDALSPLKVMSRGYSLTYKNDHVIKSVEELSEYDEISIRFAKGRATAQVTEIQKEVQQDEQ